MNRETRNAFMVIGAVLAGLLVISLVFSGSPEDAVIGEAPAGHGEEAAEEVPAEEAATAEAPGEAGAPAEAEAAEEPAETAEAPAEEAPAEEAAAAEAGTEEVALAGDPEAGERVWRQCQACHQIGEDAQNRVGPHLTGVVGRQFAAVEDFTYSDALAAAGLEGREWTPEELRGFLANPREYIPGTAMAYAGVRSEDDLDNLIAYLATHQ